jgi:hypothetical protein
MSTLQKPSIWCCCRLWHEGSLEYLLTCCDWFSRKCKSRQLQETCGGSYNILQEAHLQHATQDVFSTVTRGLILAWLWWWILWLFLPGHLSNGEQMQGQMECCHFSWLLLESEEDVLEVQYKWQANGALFNSCVLLPYSSIINFFFNQNHCYDLNASLMLCIANSTK